MGFHNDGLVHERRNSIANALELRLSCTNRRYQVWFEATCYMYHLSADIQPER